MNQCFLALLSFTFFSLLSFARKDYPSHLNCEYLGSLIITPKGHQELVKLSLDKVKKTIKEAININFSDAVSKQEIIFYESPKDCQSDKIDQHIKDLFTKNTIIVGKSPSTGKDCFLYPILNSDGSFYPGGRLVPMKISLQNSKIHDFQYQIGEPKCDKFTCHIRTKLTKLQFTGAIVIEKNKSEGKIFESPSVLMDIQKGGATVDTVVTLNENENLHLLEGSIIDVKLDLSKVKVKLIILDPETGKEITRTRKRHLFRIIATTQRKKSMKQNFNSDPCKTTNESIQKEKDFVEAQIAELLDQEALNGKSDDKLNKLGDQIAQSYDQWSLERVKKSNCKSKKTPVPEVLFSDSQYNKPLDQCNDFRCYTKFLPYGKIANKKAALEIRGFSNTASETIFASTAHIINQSTLKNPQVNQHFEGITKKQMIKVSKHIQETLAATGDTINQAVLSQSFDIQIPIVDLAATIRLKNIDDTIKEKEEKLNDDDFLTNAFRNNKALNSKIFELKKKKAELETYLDEKKDGTNLTLQAIFGQTEHLSRYSVFDSNKNGCTPAVKTIADNSLVIDNDELIKSNFAIDLPIKTVEGYVKDMWVKNKKICLKSLEQDCDKSILRIEKPPEFEWNKERNSYDVIVRGAKGENLHLLIRDQEIDFKFSANFSKCEGSNKFCLELSDPQIKRQTERTNWFNLGNNKLNAELEKAQEGLKETLQKPIELGNISPPPFKESILYQEPIVKRGGVVIPINIDSLPDELFEASHPKELP